MLRFRGINTEEKNARRPTIAPRPSPCSPARQLRETPRAFSHDPSGYQKALVAMSKRTGMTVSQIADEVLYTGLIEMQELDAPGLLKN